MNSKIKLLLWERWQRTRWAVITAFMLPLMGCLMYMSSQRMPFYFSENIIRVFWHLGFLIISFSLLVSHSETRDMDLSFPKRLFRLPVSTKILFVLYLGYGIAIVAIQSLILFGFEKLFLDPITFKWTYLLWLETVYIVLQTLSWLSWLVGPGARFLCLAPLLAGVYVYSLLFFGDWYKLSKGGHIICIIIIILCGVIAFWSVSAHRHGARSDWRWIDSLFGVFRRKPSKRFASALQAQIWFEMRQTGRLFPLAALCVIVILLSWWVFFLDMPYYKFGGFFPIVLVMTVFVAFIAGFLVFGIYHRDHVSGASNFWLRRPIATRTLAVARLHAMVLSLACVLAILMIVALAVLLYHRSNGPYWISWGSLFPVWLGSVKWGLLEVRFVYPTEAITITFLSLYGFVLFYWTMLRLAPTLLIGGIAIALITWLMRLLIGDIAVLWVWNALVVLLPLGVLASFYVARRCNLITTATLVIATCLFPVAVISMWAFPWWGLTGYNSFLIGFHSLSLTQRIFIMSAATLPFIPVVATPLLMERLRHR